MNALPSDYFEQLVSLCPDGVISVDRQGRIVLFNRAAEWLFGYRAADILGKMSITEIYADPQAARRIKKAIHAETGGGVGRLEGHEVEVRTIQGEVLPIRLSATLIFKDGREIGSVGFFHDLSSRKRLEDRLRVLSITDALTGLYNQRHFHAVLEREVSRIARYRRPLSLICMDLDHFKNCNDILGHLEGDRILRLMGEVLGALTRATDQAFRYGGDEFFVLLPETPLPQAVVAAEKIRQAFNDRWPYEDLGNQQPKVRVTLSMGVAQANGGEAGKVLIKRADLAMYDAKNEGGDRVVAASMGH